MGHPTVFIVGLHGTGKTTIARRLTKNHHWSHLSIGDLSRVVRNGQIPSGISLRLITELASHVGGARLGDRMIETLLAEIAATSLDRPVICDGFPAEAAHLPLLPPGSLLVYTRCEETVREARLNHRAAQTRRKWTPGTPSERDNALPELVAKAQAMHDHGQLQFMTLDNGTNGIDALTIAVGQVIDQTATAF